MTIIQVPLRSTSLEQMNREAYMGNDETRPDRAEIKSSGEVDVKNIRILPSNDQNASTS